MATALRELAAVIPHADALTLPGLGHSGPQNDGRPQVAARVLRDFLKAE